MVWLHAASVGELMAALPVIDRLQAVVPDIVIIHTFTSPSAAEWPTPKSIRASDYAPQDSLTVLRPLFEALRPDLIVVSRGDLWPGMARCARHAKVPIAVVGGTIRASSLRLRLPGRAVLNQACRDLAFVGVVTNQDAVRWRQAGVPSERILVTGDPRDALILERTPSRVPAALASWAERRRVMVAGSTHPADERALADMFTAVVRNRSDVGLLVVPHDPDRSNPAWKVPGFAWSRWPGTTSIGDTPCIFAPVKGMLADLYLLASVAYVGGGFDRGAHSLAEPAVYGIPTATGPRAAISAEAHRFLETGAVKVLTGPTPADTLVRWWLDLLDDDAGRWRAGLRGRAVLDASAARTSAEAICRLMADHRSIQSAWRTIE